MLIGLTLGAGVYFTNRLAIPIGLHYSWNFIQANVFGFPLSGLVYPARNVSLFRIEQISPEIWTEVLSAPKRDYWERRPP